jgi:hypothetical protein
MGGRSGPDSGRRIGSRPVGDPMGLENPLASRDAEGRIPDITLPVEFQRLRGRLPARAQSGSACRGVCEPCARESGATGTRSASRWRRHHHGSRDRALPRRRRRSRSCESISPPSILTRAPPAGADLGPPAYSADRPAKRTLQNTRLARGHLGLERGGDRRARFFSRT